MIIYVCRYILSIDGSFAEQYYLYYLYFLGKILTRSKYT